MPKTKPPMCAICYKHTTKRFPITDSHDEKIQVCKECLQKYFDNAQRVLTRMAPYIVSVSESFKIEWEDLKRG